MPKRHFLGTREIEESISSHEAVAGAVVAKDEDKYLIVYVVFKEALETDEERAKLERSIKDRGERH